MPPGVFFRVVPLEAHETSYFADSARVLSFSRTSSFIQYKVTNFASEKIQEIIKKKQLLIIYSLIKSILKTDLRAEIKLVINNYYNANYNIKSVVIYQLV